MKNSFNNPWLDIPAEDYENHMLEVGQAQALNRLVKGSLNRYRPESFALIGCSTGNGLEHVNANLTSRVFALDINEGYLEKVRLSYESALPGLKTIRCDIGSEELPFSGVDLMFAGLVLEYTHPERALLKMINALKQGGVIHLIIQWNKATTFVSKTRYTSLEKLSTISSVVDKKEVDDFMINNLMIKLSEEEIPLTSKKSFVSLKYRKP